MDDVGGAVPRPPESLISAPAEAIENTSGRGPNAWVPPEIRGWNWGALVFGWFWGIFNRVWISLLTLIPLVSLVMIFVLAAKGNEWAWQKKRWDSVEHFKRTQRRWGIAAAVVVAVSIIGAILAGVFLEAPLERNPELTQVIDSDDGDFWMRVPETWTMDDTLHDDADLAVSNGPADQYLVMLAEPKGRRPLQLAPYARLTRSFLLESLDSATEGDPQRVMVGEHEGLQVVVRGSLEGEDLVYLHTAVIGDKHAFQVVAWTLASNWESSSGTLRAISDDVHEM